MPDQRNSFSKTIAVQFIGLPQGLVATIGIAACLLVGIASIFAPHVVGFASPALGQAILFIGWAFIVFIFYLGVGHKEQFFNPTLCIHMLLASALPFWIAYR